jgi:hypothetical protein
MHATILSLLILLADAPTAPNLHGQVMSPDGAAVPQADVIVYSAAPKKKDAVALNKFEYPDCSKSSQADATGAFKIDGVDLSLNYELLVLADGYRPLMLKKVDPARGEIRAKLIPAPTEFNGNDPLRGHVVDSNGDPVVGARIEPFGARDGTERWWGGTNNVCENDTYTDAKGNFLLLTKKPNLALDIKVWPRQASPYYGALLSTGDAVNEVTVTPGASITGRVVKDGQPLKGIVVRLSQEERDVEHYIGEFDATTDDQGKFTFKHVMPNTKYNLYPTMKSLAPYGAFTMQTFNSDQDGSTSDAGDVSVEKGLTISGKFFCADDKPVPSGLKPTLSRWNASDSVDVKVDKDGKFEVKNVSADLYGFWLRTNGYHLSEDNQSYEPANSDLLLGRIDQDIDDLRIQLDPGPSPQRNYNGNKWQTLQSTQITGVPSPQ